MNPKKVSSQIHNFIDVTINYKKLVMSQSVNSKKKALPMLRFYYVWDLVWVFGFRTRTKSPCRGIQIVSATKIMLMGYMGSSKGFLLVFPLCLQISNHSGTLAIEMGPQHTG